MTEVTDSLPLFHQRNRSPSPISSRSINVPQKIPQVITQNEFQDLLSSFQLMDISEDKNFIALIDESFTLHVCGIKWGRGVIIPTSYWSRDISIHYPPQHELSNQETRQENTPQHEGCTNPVFTFLSVASGTGYVAVSFAQLYEGSGLFLRGMLDPNYKTCGLYKGNGQDDATYFPFQGRAVFTKDGLALVGDQKLTMLDPETFKHKYFCDLFEVKKGHEAIIVTDNLVKNTTWAKFYPVRENGRNNSQGRKDGDILIAVTQHIKHGILAATYKGYTTKMWSITDGSLIASFKTIEGEYIAAISKDNQYFATFNDKTKTLLVYLKDGALPLHKYLRKLVENEIDETVNFINFDSLQHYLLIAGYKNQPNGSPMVFFEVWSMSCEKCLIYREADSPEMMPLPFIIEDKEGSRLKPDGYDNPYFATDFYGLIASRDDRNTLHLIPNETLLFDQETAEFENGYLGVNYSIKRISRDNVHLTLDNHEITETLDSIEHLVVYLISHENERYMLRYGLNMIQLWKLNEIEATITPSETDIFDFGTETNHLIQIQDENRGQRKYYNSIEDSTLLYIRSFKGWNYTTFSTFRDDWKIISNRSSQHNQMLNFMDDKGRVLIDITYKQHLVKDEIFLPLPGLNPEIPIIYQSSDGNLNLIPSVFYHEIESFSQTLHYLYFSLKKRKNESPTKYKEHRQIETLFNKTLTSLRDMLYDGDIAGYFNTKSGSKTLAMLASFPHGQNIIVEMIKSQTIDIPVRIISYPGRDNEKENVLTVLIKEKRYELFQLLFNISIINCHVQNSVDFFSLLDSLLALKRENLPEILLRCIQRLSYLPADSKNTELLHHEYFTTKKYSYLNNFTLGYLKKYHLEISPYFGFITKWYSKSIEQKLSKKFKIFIQPSRLDQTCIAPLSNSDIFKIISYASSAGANKIARSSINDNRKIEFEEDYVMVEVLIDNKWKNYARLPFYFSLLIQVIYCVSYTVAISFPEEVFHYTPGTAITDNRHLGCIGLTIITGLYMFIQEIVQVWIQKKSYFKYFYNYLDIAAFLLPITTFCLLRYNSEYLYGFSAATSLILCIHFILRLRVLRRIGILLQIIIQLTEEVFPTLIVTIMLVLSFTLALTVLLRRQENSFFQDQYGGNATTTDVLNSSNVTLNDQSQQNLFTDGFLGFTTVWFFLYGVFDPMFSGDIGNYKMALTLIILFSLFTALILLNVVIAIMNGSIEKTIERGNRNWYIHFIAVVDEIEIFWGWLIGSYKPPFVYYGVSKDMVLLHYEKIQEETEKLLERKDLIRKTTFENM